MAEQPVQPDSYEKPEPRKMSRNVPPLAWVLMAVLVAVFVVAGLMRGGSRETPSGEVMPQTRESSAYMPPAPATGDAPATPGGEITTRD